MAKRGKDATSGRAALDLATARVLVTNDDGIQAPGIKALERIARALSDDVWTVAPETEQSAMSHSLTLRRPLSIHKLSRRRLAVDGTPTDCVLVAQRKILLDKPASLVLSGINRGANLGEDVIYSGTVAGAREAALLRVPAIAFSQYGGNGSERMTWTTAEHFGPDIVRALVAEPWPDGVLFNVNFPALSPGAVKGVRITQQGRRASQTLVKDVVGPYGRRFVWVGDYTDDFSPTPASDLTAVVDGFISITPLHIDNTHRGSLKRLKELFP